MRGVIDIGIEAIRNIAIILIFDTNDGCPTMIQYPAIVSVGGLHLLDERLFADNRSNQGCGPVPDGAVLPNLQLANNAIRQLQDFVGRRSWRHLYLCLHRRRYQHAKSKETAPKSPPIKRHALSSRYPAPYTEISFTPFPGFSPSFSRICEICVSSVRDSPA